jgi:hypothetical protein
VLDVSSLPGSTIFLLDLFLVLNATFSNISAISWRPVLVVEEAGVSGVNHRPWASNYWILEHCGIYSFFILLSVLKEVKQIHQFVPLVHFNYHYFLNLIVVYTHLFFFFFGNKTIYC